MSSSPRPASQLHQSAGTRVEVAKSVSLDAELLEDGDEQAALRLPALRVLGAAVLGVTGDEVIHGILNMMNAGAAYPTLQWAVPIHPTVSELIPTVLGELKQLGA